MTMTQVTLIIHSINIPQRIFGEVSGAHYCLPASKRTIEV